MHIKINPKLIEKDKLYGTTTVGTKGQIVIPVKAREDLKIIPGDDLLVIGKHGMALGLIKSEDLAGMIEMIMENITEKEWREKIKLKIVKLFGDLNKYKKGKKQ